MANEYSPAPKAVVCFGDDQTYKRAALLFKSIVPLGHFPFDLTGDGSQFDGADVPWQVLNVEALNSWLGDPSVLGSWGDAAMHIGMYASSQYSELEFSSSDELKIQQQIEQISAQGLICESDTFHLPKQDFDDRMREARSSLFALVETNKENGFFTPLWDMPTLLASNKRARFFVQQFLKKAGLDYPVVLPILPVSRSGDGVEEILAKFTNFPQIDVSKMSWDHVLEVRKDPSSAAKLQRLCNFVYKNYRDKPLSYVQDDLGLAIEDYRRSCKHHGISLAIGELQVVMKSSDLIRTGLSTLFGAAVGGPGGALAGLSIGIAEMALTFAKQKSDFDEKLHGNGLSYVLTMTGKAR